MVQGEAQVKSGNGLGVMDHVTSKDQGTGIKVQGMRIRGQLESSLFQGMKEKGQVIKNNHTRMSSGKMKRCLGITRRGKIYVEELQET